MTADAFTVPDAIDLLYMRLLDASPNRDKDSADLEHSHDMARMQDAALMIGIELGRRLGSQPMK